MQIHYEELPDTNRYIKNKNQETADEATIEANFERYLRPIRNHKAIDKNTRILEIGTGPGWFPIFCKLSGLQCKGLEISPQLVEYARQLGLRHGVECDVEVGNVEETDLGRNQYDIIIASNLFEHVQHWELGLSRVYEALKPGGVLFFESTNKFSLTSGEYSFPLYGWLPNRVRYRLRVAKQGPDIMKLGIDFNQFTHPELRRQLNKCGFSRVFDRIEMADERFTSTLWRRWIVKVSRKVPLAKALALTFAEATRFLCIK